MSFKRFVGRTLCLFGFHRWTPFGTRLEMTDSPVGVIAVFVPVWQCGRCGCGQLDSPKHGFVCKTPAQMQELRTAIEISQLSGAPGYMEFPDAG